MVCVRIGTLQGNRERCNLRYFDAMDVTSAPRSEVIQAFGVKQGDTGCPEVQVALLTRRIRRLTEHVGVHKKDHSTRRGLLMLVSQRARLLRYLSRIDAERYRKVIEKLGLRK
jgi:small subunit ribosomal protein S15